MKKPREVRVAMIGHGFMGRAHSNAFRQVGPFMQPKLTPRLAVVCGRNAPAVQEAAARLGWDEWATDWREVVRRPDIDLVDVVTPGDSHAAIAIAAARAGKAVLCEKPLANSVREAEAMLAAVKKAGVVHMLCHNYRRIPAVMLAKQIIDSGQLGTLYHFRGAYLQDWVLAPGMVFGWRFDKKKTGSGALGDIASHSLDLARFLVGEITEVAGELTTFVKKHPLPENPRKMGRKTVDDAAAALVRFANGARGTIEGTRVAKGRKNANRFEVNGSKGSVAFDLERLNELQLFLADDPVGEQGFRTILATDPSHPYVKSWWPPGHLIGYEHTFTHTVYDLLEGVAKGRSPRPNFEDGVQNQRVMAAWEKAAKTRRWERV